LLGGFRSLLITYIMIFGLQFYLEGLHRTKLLPMFLFALVVAGTLMIPFTSRLPTTIQRALAFLPVSIDPMVRQGAEASSEWRLAMWKAVLPQVPQYLLLGKGYAMSVQDFELSRNGAIKSISEDQWGSALAGDYHSGPLSVVIPFGIWGCATFLWIIAAGWRVLYCNFRHGDPALRNTNALLLATYITQIVLFFFLTGAMQTDILRFLGWLGLSVSLNGGMARPVPATTQKIVQSTKDFPGVLPRPRPAFER